MLSKMSLLDYLVSLLSSCRSSKTSYKEGKGKVSISPEEGEDICFFIIDNDVGYEALKIDRKALRTDKKGVICDCLVFFGRKGTESKEYVEKFCLVELKGSDLEHVMHQIINTHEHLWELLTYSPCKHNLSKFVKKAYIYRQGNTPKETKHLTGLRNQLINIFESNFEHGRNSDLGPFLRK